MRMAQGSPNLLLSVFLSSGDHDLQDCHHDALEQAAKGEGKISSAPLTLPVLLSPSPVPSPLQIQGVSW